MDEQEKLLSIDELEAELEADPSDATIKEDLAYALVERYFYGPYKEGHETEGAESDLARMREVVADLPDDMATWPRAYLAYLDEQNKECIAWITKWAIAVTKIAETPLDSDQLYDCLFVTFSALEGLMDSIADVFAKKWPDSALVLTLLGYADMEKCKWGEAIDHFVSALSVEADYWIAAQGCAAAYQSEQNWHSAADYYRRALKSEPAWGFPGMYSGLAWCSGKLKDYAEEEKAYRSCLELDPDYEFARNNLGWSLMKQRRYQEAIETFEECIKRGNDGKHPIWNKCRALKKLGRYSEAIEFIQSNSRKNKLGKWAQEEIAKLQSLIEKQQQEDIAVEKAEETVEEDEKEAAGSSQEEEAQPEEEVKPGPVTRFPQQIPQEKILEELILRQIQRGQVAFGRTLEIYESEEGYGQQFPIANMGRIDLLTEDISTSELVIVELKRGKTDDVVVGQTCRYMAWVRENLTHDGQKVKGIICVGEASKTLLLAASNVPDLEVFEYDLSFRKVSK